jgi:hypothetical protein
MTTSAWVMLTVTWSVVAFFTARFFLVILRTPMKRDATDGED